MPTLKGIFGFSYPKGLEDLTHIRRHGPRTTRVAPVPSRHGVYETGRVEKGVTKT